MEMPSFDMNPQTSLEALCAVLSKMVAASDWDGVQDCQTMSMRPNDPRLIVQMAQAVHVGPTDRSRALVYPNGQRVGLAVSGVPAGDVVARITPALSWAEDLACERIVPGGVLTTAVMVMMPQNAIDSLMHEIVVTPNLLMRVRKTAGRTLSQTAASVVGLMLMLVNDLDDTQCHGITTDITTLDVRKRLWVLLYLAKVGCSACSNLVSRPHHRRRAMFAWPPVYFALPENAIDPEMVPLFSGMAGLMGVTPHPGSDGINPCPACMAPVSFIAQRLLRSGLGVPSVCHLAPFALSPPQDTSEHTRDHWLGVIQGSGYVLRGNGRITAQGTTTQWKGHVDDEFAQNASFLSKGVWAFLAAAANNRDRFRLEAPALMGRLTAIFHQRTRLKDMPWPMPLPNVAVVIASLFVAGEHATAQDNPQRLSESWGSVLMPVVDAVERVPQPGIALQLGMALFKSASPTLREVGSNLIYRSAQRIGIGSENADRFGKGLEKEWDRLRVATLASE